MLRAMLRELRAHPGRVSMTLIAITLGVAFVVATWVVSDSAAETVAGGVARSDLAVEVRPESRGAISVSQRDQLAALPGVDRAEGVVLGQAALVKSDGKVGQTYYPEVGGTDWDTSQRFALVSGTGPMRSGEVALEEEAAAEAGLTVGSPARVLLSDGREDTATVVGVFAYRKLGFEDTPALAYDETTARRLLSDDFARVELYGDDEAALASSARAALGGDFAAQTATELAAQREEWASSQAKVVRNFLLAFAGVALFAGMFVIANTFTMLVAQRTRQFALLRAVGASRRQVRRAVLGEAAALGLIGATLGVLFGIGLGLLGMKLLSGTGESVAYVVPPSGIAAGYAVGVLVTLVSAYGSARRGARVAPVAALRTDAALPRRSIVFRTVAGSFAVIAGVATVLATSGSQLSEAQRAVGMAGAMLACLGVILLTPLLVTAVLRPLSRLVARRGGPVSRLAVRNAARDPRRTAATASSLMIGLTLVCAFATVGETMTSAVTSSYLATVPSGTTTVQAASWGWLDQSVLDKARTASGVDVAIGARRVFAEISGGSAKHDAGVSAIDAAGFSAVLTPEILSGSADLAAGLLVSEEFSTESSIGAGDQVSLSFGEQGRVDTVIAGVYRSFDGLNGVLMDVALLPDGADAPLAQIFASGSDPGAARAGLDAAFANRPDVLVLGRAELIEQAISPYQLALNIIYALLGAAVVIAVFGVVNTLALSVLERTREIGVFRAIGASRRLVRRAVRGESVIIASYGGLLGVGVGLLLGGVMQHMIMTRPVLDFAVPYPVVVTALLGMVVVGVLAALWPARRAAKTNVLAAIAVE